MQQTTFLVWPKNKERTVNVFPGQYIEFRLCALNRCVWFHDFVVRIVGPFSYFCLIFGWLSPELPHVLFINACMYCCCFCCCCCFLQSFSLILWKYFPFELLITIDWYVRMYILTWNCVWALDTIPFSLTVNWQLLVYKAKCVGKQSNINSNLYLGWEIRTRTIYLYMRSKNSCDSQFRAILSMYLFLSCHTHTHRMFFFPSTERPLLVWFNKTETRSNSK